MDINTFTPCKGCGGKYKRGEILIGKDDRLSFICNDCKNGAK